MEIDQIRLDAFRSLFREKFGTELTPAETLEKALALVGLMKQVYQPITEDDLRSIQARRQELIIQRT